MNLSSLRRDQAADAIRWILQMSHAFDCLTSIDNHERVGIADPQTGSKENC